jgi:hypothetical protein
MRAPLQCPGARRGAKCVLPQPHGFGIAPWDNQLARLVAFAARTEPTVSPNAGSRGSLVLAVDPARGSFFLAVDEDAVDDVDA